MWQTLQKACPRFPAQYPGRWLYPAGATFATPATCDGGAAAKLIEQWENAPRPAIVFTGYIPPGTPADRLVKSGRAKFLPRRMTENYLLNADAIAAVLSALGEEGLKAAAIDSLLRKYATTRAPKDAPMEYGSPEFFARVDGANLLKDVFNAASDTRHSYRKVRDGVELLRVILNEDRAYVDELVEFVKGLTELPPGAE